MTSAAMTATLLEALRGDRSERPASDPTLAGGLRAWLDDEISTCTATIDFRQPIRLSPRTVACGPLSIVPPTLALARGALVGALVAQRISLGEIHHPMDDALSALEADPSQSGIVEAVHALDPLAFAQLAAEVDAHDTVLGRHLSGIPASWLPRSNVMMSANLAGGRVVLGAMAHLVLGPPAEDVASVCLLTVTTAALDATVTDRLSVLALIETLRAGAAPLRVASLSTGTDERVILNVSDATLIKALTLVAAATTQRTAP